MSSGFQSLAVNANCEKVNAIENSGQFYHWLSLLITFVIKTDFPTKIYKTDNGMKMDLSCDQGFWWLVMLYEHNFKPQTCLRPLREPKWDFVMVSECHTQYRTDARRYSKLQNGELRTRGTVYSWIRNSTVMLSLHLAVNFSFHFDVSMGKSIFKRPHRSDQNKFQASWLVHVTMGYVVDICHKQCVSGGEVCGCPPRD